MSWWKSIISRIGRQEHADGIHADENVRQPADGCGIHRFASARERTVSDCGRVRVLQTALSAQRGGAADRSARDQVRDLIAAASSCGLLVSAERRGTFGDLVSKRTGESSVYWNRGERVFYKVKNPAAKSPIKRTAPEDWLYEHVIHNILFPETAYEFIGLLEECGEVRIVLRQRAVGTETFPDEAQVASELAVRGLLPEDRYFFGDGVVSVTDVSAHGDNVLLADDGKVCFIDPLIRLKRSAVDVIEWLTGFNPNEALCPPKDLCVSASPRDGFTLIELLVVVAILGIMVTAGVVSLTSGQGAARTRGAARDVVASIRHARSVALVSQQPATIAFSNESAEGGETVARVKINSVRIINTNAVTQATTLDGEVVSLTGEDEEPKPAKKTRGYTVDGEDPAAEADSGGEDISDILFSPVSEDVMRGIKLKVLTGDKAEEAVGASGVSSYSTVNRTTSRVSVFSTADYINSKYQEKVSQEAAAKKAEEDAEKSDSAAEEEGTAPVSIVWEVNGRTEPHCVWVFRDGTKPEDGLLIRVDRFGAVKVLRGDGKEDED